MLDVIRHRRYFAWSFVGTVLLLVYASMLPIKYRACSLDQAWSNFVNLPWLDIQVYGRADWVANLLVVLPLGWLGAAAIDWGRSSQRLLLLLMPALISFLCFVAVGIEYLQAWFPPRTQSLNDIAAGCLGALLGPVVWLVTGRWTMQTLFNSLKEGLRRQRLWHAALLYAAASLVFAALPFDLVVSVAELKEKADLGRLEIMPDFVSPIAVVKSVALSVIRVIPLTLLLCFVRGVRVAILYSIAFAILCELIQVPVFTRTASLFHAIVSVITAIAVGGLYKIKGVFFPILRRSGFWWSLGCVSSLGLLAVVVLKADRVVTDPVELADRWQRFFNWPMAGYYYQAEFAALTTLVYKFIIFTWIGGCIGAAIATNKEVPKKSRRVTAIFMMLSIATAVEVSQIYLEPHIPDAFDVIVYLATMLISSAVVQRLGESA